jgi:hypothetical protein
MYRYQYVDNLIPKVTDHKLFLGTGVHHALAAYYENDRRDSDFAMRVYNAWVELEMSRCASNMTLEVEEQFKKDAELGRKMLTNYFPWAMANDAFEVAAVEQPFAVPIWTPQGKPLRGVRQVGRFDGIARDIYGHLWLMEYKTYSQVPSESELRLDAQAGYYLVAAQQLFPDDQVMGVIYTILRKVDPARAKGDVIYRTRVMRNGCELEQLRNRLYVMYKRITSDKYFPPTPGMHCGWRCAYKRLCIAEEDGSDVKELIDVFYEISGKEVA